MSAEQDSRDRLAEGVAQLNVWQLALADAMTATTCDASPVGGPVMDTYRLDLVCDDDPDTPLEIAYFEASGTESALTKAARQLAEMASANADQAAGELSGDLWVNAGGRAVYVTTILAPDDDLEVFNHG